MLFSLHVSLDLFLLKSVVKDVSQNLFYYAPLNYPNVEVSLHTIFEIIYKQT